MSTLETYESRKQAILRAYDQVLHGEVTLDIAGEERAALVEARENLTDERFVLAVCGQMNAGKSTLLNGLLFGREVLPSSPTTMTAKIARLQGGADERIEAELYTRREFDDLVRAAARAGEEGGASQELSRAREAARAHGLREDQLLTADGRVEKRAGLDGLREFAAVPDDGGLYTPYVREVRVVADKKWLYQVTVADTPGTSDPNPQRDRITKDWIRRADAVVYVSYAGQAGMDEADLEFIDKNLLHVSKDRLLIAVNKLDTVANADGVAAHIRSLSQHQDPRIRSLFSDLDNVLTVSGLGGLFDRLRGSGAVLNEDQLEQVELLEEDGFLDPERHRLGHLAERIEKQLIETKGARLLSSHARKLLGAYERAEQNIDMERALAEQRAEELMASHEELGRRIGDVQEAQEEIRDAVADCTDRLRAIMDDKLPAVVEACERVRQELMADVNSELRVGSATKAASAGAWTLKDALRRSQPRLMGIFGQVTEALRLEVEAQHEALRETLADKGRIRLRLPLLASHSLPLINAAHHSVTRDIEEQLRRELDLELPWYTTWLGIGGVDRARDFVREKIGEAAGKAIDGALGSYFENLQTGIGKATQAIEIAASTLLQRRLEQLEEMRRSQDRSAEQLQEARRRVRELHGEVETVQLEKKKLAQAIGEALR